MPVGRFGRGKGFHDLIQAFNAVERDDWKLVIVGRADHEDSYSSRLKAYARSNPHVILSGFLKGKPIEELYTHAGLFLLPSYHEGLPLVLLEAMSYGLSCIASGIPANRNLNLSEDRFFSPGNVDQTADKIAKYIETPLSEEEKARIQSYIAAEYDWGTIAEKSILVYNAVVAKPNC